MRRSFLWIGLFALAFFIFWSLVNLASGDSLVRALEVAGKAVGLGALAGLAYFWLRRLYKHFVNTFY